MSYGSALSPVPHSGSVGQGQRFAFLFGFVVGFVVNVEVVAGLFVLKTHDTSVNPWETLTAGSLVAGGCLVPVQLIACGVLAMFRRTRLPAAGLAVAAALGLVAFVTLLFWSNGQADAFGRSHHLAQVLS